jgi:hypothetical protein
LHFALQQAEHLSPRPSPSLRDFISALILSVLYPVFSQTAESVLEPQAIATLHQRGPGFDPRTLALTYEQTFFWKLSRTLPSPP